VACRFVHAPFFADYQAKVERACGVDARGLTHAGRSHPPGESRDRTNSQRPHTDHFSIKVFVAWRRQRGPITR
jgi:hypothetical protein